MLVKLVDKLSKIPPMSKYSKWSDFEYKQSVRCSNEYLLALLV